MVEDGGGVGGGGDDGDGAGGECRADGEGGAGGEGGKNGRGVVGGCGSLSSLLTLSPSSCVKEAQVLGFHSTLVTFCRVLGGGKADTAGICISKAMNRPLTAL